LWDLMIQESTGTHLASTGHAKSDDEANAWLAIAYFMKNEAKAGSQALRSLQRKSLAVQSQILDVKDEQAANDAAKEDKEASDALESLESNLERLEKLIARISAASAAMRRDPKAVTRHAEAASLDAVMHAQWLAEAGDLEKAEAVAAKAVQDGMGEVRPLAVWVNVLWKRDKHDEAIKHFEELRRVAHSADIDTPMLMALRPIADKLELGPDWRMARTPPSDLGERPELNTLGPEAWQPPSAIPFTVKSVSGDDCDSSHWDGKPQVIIFYLGSGCLHCVEQLKTFTPKIDDFRAAGIEVRAISTEDVATLAKGIHEFDAIVPFALHSDADHVAFKAYQCWDDFESVPLHGTFFIDANGRVRWHDIGAEPFQDVEFLLQESKRLLKQTPSTLIN
jgi:peroxiredoxin